MPSNDKENAKGYAFKSPTEDPFTVLGLTLTGKYELLSHLTKSASDAKTIGRAGGFMGAIPDLTLAAAKASAGQYDEAGEHVVSAAGGWAGAAYLGGKGFAIGLPYGPYVAGALGLGGALIGGWGGSEGAKIMYNHGSDALRWTGNTMEGGIRDTTQGYFSPMGEDIAHYATDLLKPGIVQLSDIVQGLADEYGPGLEASAKKTGSTLESLTKVIGGYAEKATKVAGGELASLFGSSSPTEQPGSNDSSSPWQSIYAGDQLWEGLSSNYKFSDIANSYPSGFGWDYYGGSPVESAALAGSPSPFVQGNSSLPFGVGSYLDFGDFTFPESPSHQPPNDNIDGWDVLHMIDPNIPLYVTPSYSSPQSDSSNQKPQPSAINTAGSAINTAYNVMSFGSTLQDVLTGRRSDPGAYLSLINSTAQGLSWAAKTDGVKDIVSAIGDLQDPLDTMADVTGGAMSGWGLYQNIAGLAQGEVTAQNVLGVAANAGQLYTSLNDLAPDLIKEVIPSAVGDAIGGIGNIAGGALSAIGLVQGVQGLLEGEAQSPMDILGIAKAS